MYLTDLNKRSLTFIAVDGVLMIYELCGVDIGF